MGLGKVLAISSMTMLFLVSLLGFASAGMPVSANGHMSSCLLMPGMPGTICHMSPLEHVGTVQNMLMASAQTMSFAFLLLSLLIATVSVAWLSRLYFNLKQYVLGRLLFPHTDRVLISRPLQELFSSGILNSKAY